MAKPEETAPASPAFTQADFAALIGAAVAKSIAENSPKKVSFGDYVRKAHAGRPKLRRETWENGMRVNVDVLSATEINLLNQIHRTGRYIDRMVEAIVREEGADEVVEIRYNCKTADHRFELKGKVKDFEDLLTQIVAAQKAEDAEEVEAKGGRRHVGDNKAFRDAQARVAALEGA